MKKDICGIILKVSYPSMGDTSKIEVLDKTMLEWVKFALGEHFIAEIDFSDAIPLPELIRPHLNDSEYTVVLFSDTPLITKKTILEAVYELDSCRENVLKMTRGYVFKTEFLKTAEKVYADNHKFFDEEDFITAFSFKQVAMITDVLKNRILSYHMSEGVQIIDPSSTYIGCEVIIGKECVIYPNNILKGKTVIGDGVKILSGNTIENCIIDQGCEIQNSVLKDSIIGNNSNIGPYAHLRQGCKIGKNCRIGNFVEIKNSTLGDETKVAHLSYIGDAELGRGCNIGCGTVFCNYDGKNKHKTKLGDGVFIGSNSNLVAPLTIGDKAFVAAGSTITKDVPARSLAIARSHQIIKENWNNE